MVWARTRHDNTVEFSLCLSSLLSQGQPVSSPVQNWPEIVPDVSSCKSCWQGILPGYMSRPLGAVASHWEPGGWNLLVTWCSATGLGNQGWVRLQGGLPVCVGRYWPEPQGVWSLRGLAAAHC